MIKPLIAVLAVLSTAASAHAQIVIPDINKDTIVRIPPPGERNSRGATQSGPGRTQGQQFTPDDRCRRLPPSLRANTPGCQP
jgi:hypothetical protein